MSDGKMPPYGFRVRFLLSEGSAINSNSDALTISLPTEGKDLVLRSASKGEIRQSRNLTISASGFSSKDEAVDFGRRCQVSLMVCSTCLQMGVDIGKREEIPPQDLEEIAREKGWLYLEDAHGLCVYPEEVPLRFCGLSASIEISQPAESFVREFLKAIELSPELTDKQSLALELYNASHFESSLRARFVTLVAAVECLSARKKQASSVRNFVQGLIKQMKSSLEIPEKEDLVSRLGELKCQSISDSCRNLFTSYFGPEVAEEFGGFYRIRSKILHKGRVPKNINLGSETPKLDKLVSHLLLAIVTREKEKGRKGERC